MAGLQAFSRVQSVLAGLQSAAARSSESCDAELMLVERAVLGHGRPDLVDRVKRAVIVTDPAGVVTHWNRRAEQLYGWTREEAVGRNIGQLTVPGTGITESGQIMDALRAGRRWSGVFTVKDRFGRRFAADVVDAPVLDTDGRIAGIIGLSAEAAGPGNSESATVADPAGAQLAAALPLQARLLPHVRSIVLATLLFGVAAALQRGAGVTVSLLPVLAVGYATWACGRRFASALATALLFASLLLAWPASGADVGRLATFAVTAVLVVLLIHKLRLTMVQREAADEQRALLIADLRRANQAKDEFISLVSHELKTPLTTIVGNAHLLERSHDSLSPGDIRESIADIARSGDSMDAIINDLLALARFDQAAPTIELEPLIVVRLVEQLVSEHIQQFPYRDIRVEESGERQPVEAHEGYLRQALRNLLSNAEKYSPPDQPIEVKIVRTTDEVQVSVRDHGTGVPAAEQSAIFEPFYRSAASRSAKGIGVGLAVCQRLIEAQHGSCWVRNHPGGGAEFGVSLPVLTD